MKKWLGFLLACILIMNLIPAIGEEAGNASTEAQEEQVVYDYDDLVIGNPTQMNGQFFTALWGSHTSDIDVRRVSSVLTIRLSAARRSVTTRTETAGI